MCAKTLDSSSQSDAHPTLQQLADEARQAVLEVAWRQWRALGAAAVRTTPKSAIHPAVAESRQLQTLVDPEALILISLALMDDERRLADVLHDWGARNADLLSVQRMKNLEADYPESMRRSLAERRSWFAKVACEVGKDLRWRSLMEDHAPTGAPDAEAPPDDESIATWHPSRAKGDHAPRGTSTKSRATRARLTTDATLLLRLRLGLGVGVKADVLAYLLGNAEGWETVRDIAASTGYTVAAVRRSVDDLAAARFVASLEGQPASYSATLNEWAPLLQIEGRAPHWASWHERFVFATALLQWAEEARERPLSDYAFAAFGRTLLERHRLAFERDQIAVWSSHSSVADWGEFVQRVVRALIAWMQRTA